MKYETLANENMILYRSLAKSTKKLDEIKNIFKDFNFFDTNYKEMYEKLLRIYEVMEEK